VTLTDDELTAAIREVRERVRARYPQGSLGLDGVIAPDLLPIVHARDAAEAKVAAIGTVNPRKPGFANSIAQFFKRGIARMLEWHVREQVEFNRASMECIQAMLTAMTEYNRSAAALASNVAGELQQSKDVRAHWAEWRVAFEEKRNAGEIHILRTIGELQRAFQDRAVLLEQAFREKHRDFEVALDSSTVEIQKRLWADLEKIRGEYDRLIHTELKLIRQRVSVAPAASQPTSSVSSPQPNIDWLRFAETFRGSSEQIRDHQQMYVERFGGAFGEILDLGCGRGEFLEAVHAARGIDQSEECVAICKSKGLAAERADLFDHLASLSDDSLGGVFCSQVVEHIPPDRLPDLINLIAKKLKRGAMVAIETPDPACLAIFASHFYIDPTHTRPVPAPLLRFYLEEAGLVNIVIESLAPAADFWPSLNQLPAEVRDDFLGGLDYAIFARKP
jgi:2-polyprenyl-3-methyl-5-hydroxy-6-metoxy-1,4-benzoquinol methylase